MDSGFNDMDAAEMARILGRGTLIGIPVVFVIALIVAYAFGGRGLGMVLIAGWGAIIGGTFIGAAVLLAADLGKLAGVEKPAPREETEAGGGRHHRLHRHRPVLHG